MFRYTLAFNYMAQSGAANTANISTYECSTQFSAALSTFHPIAIRYNELAYAAFEFDAC